MLLSPHSNCTLYSCEVRETLRVIVVRSLGMSRSGCPPRVEWLQSAGFPLDAVVGTRLANAERDQPYCRSCMLPRKQLTRKRLIGRRRGVSPRRMTAKRWNLSCVGWESESLGKSDGDR